MVGVDITPSAIADAHANAARNGVPNCEWVCGKAEDVLAGILAAATTARCSSPDPDPAGQPARPASLAWCATVGAQGAGCAAGAAVSAASPSDPPAQRDAGRAATAAGGDAAAPLGAGSAAQAGPPAVAYGASSLGRDVGSGASAGPGQGLGGRGCDAGSAGRCGNSAGAALVAVVDPPRAGLHPRVLHSLLQCAALRRLVYVRASSSPAVSPDCSLLLTSRTKASQARLK